MHVEPQCPAESEMLQTEQVPRAIATLRNCGLLSAGQLPRQNLWPRYDSVAPASNMIKSLKVFQIQTYEPKATGPMQKLVNVVMGMPHHEKIDRTRDELEGTHQISKKGKCILVFRLCSCVITL